MKIGIVLSLFLHASAAFLLKTPLNTSEFWKAPRARQPIEVSTVVAPQESGEEPIPAPTKGPPPALAPVPSPSLANGGAIDSQKILTGFNTIPDYPLEARTKRLEGKVELTVEFNELGDVASLELAQSSGHVLLDEAALSAAKAWRLSPDNAPLKVQVPIEFALQ